MTINDLQNKLEVWCVSVFFTDFFFLQNALRQLKHELLRTEDVLALVRDGGDSPIGIAETEVLARALIPNTAVGVQVYEMDFIGSALAGHEEACRAVKEPTGKRLGWFALYLM